MVFKLFGQNQRHSLTRKRARGPNQRDQRSCHSIAEWQLNHLTPSPAQHVLALKRNLVSFGMLAEAKYRTTQSETSWMISRGNMKIGCGYMYNNLYALMVINPKGIVNVAKSQDSNLWHGQIGHISQAELDQLMTIGYILRLQTKADFCDHCHYGKQTRSPHSLHYETV